MERALVIDNSTLIIRRTVAVVLGAILVAAAAQVAVPLPGTPVPFTLQPLAVLLVGGLLGARFGALSMILYLAMGARACRCLRRPCPVRIARLFGPTGGYLLAYPVAAWAVGALLTPGRRPGENAPGGVVVTPGHRPGVSRTPWVRTALAVLAGLVLIHLGGLAQLAILTGNVSGAGAARDVAVPAR